MVWQIACLLVGHKYLLMGEVVSSKTCPGENHMLPKEESFASSVLIDAFITCVYLQVQASYFQDVLLCP